MRSAKSGVRLFSRKRRHLAKRVPGPKVRVRDALFQMVWIAEPVKHDGREWRAVIDPDKREICFADEGSNTPNALVQTIELANLCAGLEEKIYAVPADDDNAPVFPMPPIPKLRPSDLVRHVWSWRGDGNGRVRRCLYAWACHVLDDDNNVARYLFLQSLEKEIAAEMGRPADVVEFCNNESVPLRTVAAVWNRTAELMAA